MKQLQIGYLIGMANAKGFSTFVMDGPDMGVVRSFYKYNTKMEVIKKLLAVDIKRHVLHQ